MVEVVEVTKKDITKIDESTSKDKKVKEVYTKMQIEYQYDKLKNANLLKITDKNDEKTTKKTPNTYGTFEIKDIREYYRLENNTIENLRKAFYLDEENDFNFHYWRPRNIVHKNKQLSYGLDILNLYTVLTPTIEREEEYKKCLDKIVNSIEEFYYKKFKHDKNFIEKIKLCYNDLDSEDEIRIKIESYGSYGSQLFFSSSDLDFNVYLYVVKKNSTVVELNELLKLNKEKLNTNNFDKEYDRINNIVSAFESIELDFMNELSKYYQEKEQEHLKFSLYKDASKHSLSEETEIEKEKEIKDNEKEKDNEKHLDPAISSTTTATDKNTKEAVFKLKNLVLFKAKDSEFSIDFDIVFNKAMVSEYMYFKSNAINSCPEFRVLYKVVKAILKCNHLSDKYTGGLHSDMQFNMLIAFFAIHKLKDIDETKFKPEALYEEKLERLVYYFDNFFDYFTNKFDFNKYAFVIKKDLSVELKYNSNYNEEYIPDENIRVPYYKMQMFNEFKPDFDIGQFTRRLSLCLRLFKKANASSTKSSLQRLISNDAIEKIVNLKIKDKEKNKEVTKSELNNKETNIDWGDNNEK